MRAERRLKRRRAPSAVGDVVGQRLGRVGVEGADHRGPGGERRVPADQRHQRLVHVDHVELALADLAPRDQDAADRERRQVGDGAVGAEGGGAPERGQVVRQIAPFRRRPVQHPADPARRIDGSEHADVVATAEELLGESFDVPVHAALVRPGIWRDETYTHVTKGR